MRRTRALTAILCTAAVLVGLAPSGAAAASPAIAPWHQGAGVPAAGTLAASGSGEPASAIPWHNVGPGWFVALWGPHAAGACCPLPAGWQKQPTTLYLVDPAGGRYRVATLPAPSYYDLADWSGDGRRVLMLAPAAGNRFEVEEVDLATGRLLHHFAAATAASYQFTRPDGLAILASSEAAVQPGAGTLARLTLSGAKELTYPTSYPGVGAIAPGMLGGGGVLESLNGAELVVEARNGMALVANDGTFIKDIGPAEPCAPQRWWTATAFVASCNNASGSHLPALWLVHLDGQPAVQLTHPSAPDLGDMNGWDLAGTIYTQAAGPCGTEFLARRSADGHMVPVLVPRAKDDVHVVGTDGDRLSLVALLGCGGGQSLFWFDPATAKETPLLGPPVNGGGVLGVLPYPGLEN
ncbi:MAG TPA: hypothetical protein VME46_04320 [Acidimicrobiales bacterium]|nr:hypothetical protein [Acidimicrobiales bacterium]